MSPQRSKVSHRLLKGMTPDEAQAFIASYGRARKVLARINDYAVRASKEKSKAMDNPAAFEVTNWSHLVAWYGGFRSAMSIMDEITRIK